MCFAVLFFLSSSSSSWCHSNTLGAPWQKAPTSPQIHGALGGQWLSLVTLPWWGTPRTWTSMVPSLPSTPKIDWWALPPFRLCHCDFFFLNSIHRVSIACDCLWLPEAAAAAPLPSELPSARQRGERDSPCWRPLRLQQLWSPQPHTPHHWSRHHDGWAHHSCVTFPQWLAMQCFVPHCGISGMLFSTAPSSSSLWKPTVEQFPEARVTRLEKPWRL